jgi:basic amino acid/polyamine antiporter, APA family
MKTDEPKLIRGIGLGGATALNMIDMIGVGPFITIPLIVAAMGGPQAMLGWIFGAIFAICDGLVWAELGAAMPGSGGSYRYLKEIYGPRKLGRMLSFLFIWQLSFSAPLSIASGCVGLSQYAGYIWPSLDKSFFTRTFQVGIPALGSLDLRILVAPATFLAISVVALSVFLLYRRITIISRMSQLLWVGVMGTIAFVITAGITHFNKDLAFSFPPNAFTFDNNFFLGLGAAMLVANYDYWGYYNVCFLGEEVREPTRNIPRALLYSILAVAAIYIVMNISILGVMPWQELVQSANTDTRFYVVSQMMERTFGHWAALLVTLLVMWTAFASVFSLLLGYSRVPYAAAVDGNYFRAFARVHPEKRFPTVSLLALGGVAALFCFLRLADIIAALVVIRIMLQFLVQTIGLLILRTTRPDFPRPFRMWLYPAPAVLSIFGFLYVLFKRKNFEREVSYAIIILIVGLIIYFIRAWHRKEWPFTTAPTPEPIESSP